MREYTQFQFRVCMAGSQASTLFSLFFILTVACLVQGQAGSAFRSKEISSFGMGGAAPHGSLHCQDSTYLLLTLCHSLGPAASFLSVQPFTDPCPFCFFKTGSHSGHPGTHCEDQASLELRYLHTSASPVLGIKGYAITPSSFYSPIN